MKRAPLAVRTTSFAPEHLPLLRRFAERVWRRPRSEAFYRWRYLQSPTFRAFLALRDGECVALLCAFARPYRLGGEQRTCVEIHDWYCLPELRASGLGVQLVRLAMGGPDPIVAVDGTQDTVSLLPRLGFRVFATATDYILPLAGSALARRIGAPPALARAAFELGPRWWFRPRARRRPRAGRVVPVAGAGPELEALYAGATGYGTLPLWEGEHFAWLTSGFPGAGHFVPLYFVEVGKLRGWGVVRAYESTGERQATLVELFAPQPDVALYTWMVSEASACAAAFRPVWIRAQTTCPVLGAALRANRFLATGTAPVMLWSQGEMAPPPPVHIGLDAADAPLLPYAESWWEPECAP